MSFIIDITEPPSGEQLQVENVFHRSSVALQDRVFGFTVLILHGVGADAQFRAEKANARADRFDVRQLFHGFRVIESQFFASTHLLGRPAERERFDVKSENNVGTHAADQLANVVIQAAHD